MKDKKEITLQQVTVYVLMALLFTFAVSLIGTVLEEGMEKQAMYIDWSRLYPFKNKIQETDFETDDVLWRTLVNRVSYLRKMVEEYSRFLFFREKYVESATIIERFLGLPNTSDYTVLNADYLVNNNDRYWVPDVIDSAKSLVDFNRFLAGMDIPLLYIQAPGKVCKEDTIAFTRDFANRNADNLLSALEDARVPVLDLRAELHRQGLVHHSLFFKTDHHWKPEAGLWATKVIADRLNVSFGFNINTYLYNPERYNYWFQNDYLGSIGRRATLAIANLEQFAFIFPKFATDLNILIPSRNLDKRGDFRVFYHQEYWKHILKNGPYSGDYYSVYFYGSTPAIFVHNNQSGIAGKKILLISDSFRLVVAPFLALGTKDLHVIDIRTGLSSFTGSVLSFIEKHSPDIVIILYTSNTIFNYKEAFYFR